MARANQHGYHINWIIAHILPHYIVLINISIIQRVSRQTSSTMHNREKTETTLCICWGSEDVWMNLYPLYYCDSNHCSSLSDHLSQLILFFFHHLTSPSIWVVHYIRIVLQIISFRFPNSWPYYMCVWMV
jgi:hypothetical protein